MKKGLSNSTRIILVLFICVVISVITFTVINSTVGSKLATEKANNEALQSTYDKLAVYIQNTNAYTDGTVQNIQNTNYIAQDYMGGISKKLILNKFEQITNEYGIQSTSLSLNEPENIKDLTLKKDINSETLNVTLGKTNISMSYSTTYNTLKVFLNDIINKKQKMKINSISISPNNETDVVTGTIDLDWAFIAGYNNYSDPTYQGSTGANSIFN